MAFSWRITPTGALADRDRPASFASQSDAESWLGENWRAMAGAGATSVTLVEDGRALYDLTLTPT